MPNSNDFESLQSIDPSISYWEYPTFFPLSESDRSLQQYYRCVLAKAVCNLQAVRDLLRTVPPDQCRLDHRTFTEALWIGYALGQLSEIYQQLCPSRKIQGNDENRFRKMLDSARILEMLHKYSLQHEYMLPGASTFSHKFKKIQSEIGFNLGPDENVLLLKDRSYSSAFGKALVLTEKALYSTDNENQELRIPLQWEKMLYVETKASERIFRVYLHAHNPDGSGTVALILDGSYSQKAAGQIADFWVSILT